MAYQVLARKWRPKTFADLVGQEHVVKALRNALDKGRLHHAYLLTGTRGVGKTTIARILAKSLNCEQGQHGEPCGVCASCTQIDAGRYVDLLEIDAASNTGIDNIREVLENAQYAPTVGKYKVYIIDEVHMLSKSAFNAMLKTLEEPPEHVKFILATTDPHKVPITVLSRCLQFVLRNMTTQQVAAHLAHVLESEQVPFEPAAVQLLGRAAMGSMRDALSLLDQAIAMGSGSVTEQDVRQMIGAVDKRYLYELLQYIVNQDGEALLEKAQEMAARAIGFDSALSELAMLLQRLTLLKTVPAALADDPEHETLARLAQYLSGEQIQLYYQCAIHGKQDLSLAPDEYAGFVMTLLRMLAFAPMAAKAHSSEGIIEGTQLHNPQEDAAAKKPLILPDSPALSAVARPSENLAAAEPLKPATEDTPPWEAPPEAEVSMHAEAAISELEPATSATQTLPDEPTPVVAETEELPAEPLIEPAQAWAEASDMMPSESVGELADVVAADEFSAAEAVQEAVYFGDDEADEEYADYPHLDAAPVLAALNESGDNSENEEEAEAEAPEFEPLPAFDGEHWAAMVRRLAPKLGAAQMVAQHAAWVRYDEAERLLMLSLTDEARATSNKERLDKIRDTLSDAYGIVLKLQTEPWRDDAGWETPLMRRKRLQQEGRRQAQMLLEADAAAQDILRLFDAQWLPDTLELAGQDEQ
ncbi:DNA polymerase III subunit gamma/tau [Uruburuella suis]|uniref:DNA polymerase III subunit gamma/tau n=1 Tax=Uruburuella suis TaxID=252130 RepID=UPI003F4AE004